MAKNLEAYYFKRRGEHRNVGKTNSQQYWSVFNEYSDEKAGCTLSTKPKAGV